MKESERYKRVVFMSIVLIALGVTFATTLSDRVGSLGIVFIGLGGLFMILGMRMKRDRLESKNQKDTEE